MPSEPFWGLLALLYLLCAVVAGPEAAVLTALLSGGFGAIAALMIRLGEHPLRRSGATGIKVRPVRS